MKNYITLFCVSLLVGISCSETRTIEDDLQGEWVYEREWFHSGTTFENPDTRGIMTFNEDETGLWLSDSGSNFGSEIEWDLQRDGAKIAITSIFPNGSETFESTMIYDLAQDGTEMFTFTSNKSYISWPDTLEEIVVFENIILTKK